MQKYFLSFGLLVFIGAGCVSAPEKSFKSGDDKGSVNAICINTCGNGTCEEIVCQGTGCPCAETANNCAQDCGSIPYGDDGIGDDEAALDDLIVITSPSINAQISSPVTVTGRARGYWYFEASFPVKVYDADNTLLGTGIAQAQSDWMVEDFVDFVATVTYTPSSTATGTIVLEKDNPSGLPENANSISLPIVF